MTASLRNAIELLSKCIENGNEVMKICNESPGILTSNPAIKQFIDNINAETNSMKAMASKIHELRQSNENQDYAKCKTELQAMINSMESISNENVNQIMEAIARSKISKSKKKFERHEELVKDIRGDDATKDFAKMLMSRNKKIINCLNHVSSMLPKSLAENADETTRGTPKLFLFGIDMHRSRQIFPDNVRKERMGTVNIHGEGTSADATSSNNTTNSRQVLHGFIKEAGGNATEVMLELIRPFATSNDSTQAPKLSATLAIEGQGEQVVEVYEINFQDVPGEGATGGPAVMAVVQNATGNLERIPMQMIPLTPGREVHGQIMQIQAPDEEQLADISLNLVDNSGAAGIMNQLQMMRTPMYLTPPKTPPAPSRNLQRARQAALQPRNLSFGEELLDDIQMSLVNDSTQSFLPKVDLTNEQISQITMNLVEDFINESLPPISPNRTVPAFATGRRNQRGLVRDRSLNLGTPTRTTRRAALPRGLDIAFDTAAEYIANSIIQENSEQLEDIDLELVSDDESIVRPPYRSPTMRDLRTPIYLTPPRTPPTPTRLRNVRRAVGLNNRELDFGEELIDDIQMSLVDDSMQDSRRFHLSNLTNENLDDVELSMAPSFNESPEVSRRHISFDPVTPSRTPSRARSRSRDRSFPHNTSTQMPQQVRVVSRQASPRRIVEIPQDEEQLSQINMSLVDMSMEPENPEWMNARTPFQLTPPRTPQAPSRVAQLRRQALPVRAFNLSEEQLDDIDLDLVNNSIYSPAPVRMFPPMSPNATQEHLSQMEISLAPNFDESSIREQIRRELPATSPGARSIFATPVRSNYVRNRDQSFHYGTPSRFPRQAQLPRNYSPIRSILPQSQLVMVDDEDEQLSAIGMDLIENEITTPERSPHRVMRTPIQLTPQRTPLAPRRVYDRGTRYPLQIRSMNLSEEQLEDIQMDLVNDSMQSPMRMPLNMSQDEQLSQINLSLAPDDSYEVENANLTFFGQNQSAADRRFDNSDLLQFDRSSTGNRLSLSGTRRRLPQPQIQVSPESPYRTINQVLQPPLRNYLAVTPSPRGMSRSFNARSTPGTSRSGIRNRSMPTRLLQAPQTPRRSLDRSLNSVWQSAQRRNEALPFIPSAEFAPRIIQSSYDDNLLDDIEPMEFADPDFDDTF